MENHVTHLSPPYAGKCFVLGTKHAKSIGIAPPFWEELGAGVLEYVLDTDQFGTFSGEIEREGNTLECARRKCEYLLERLGDKVDFALVSEGSFGPHPFIPFLPCDYEILYLIDKKHGFHMHLSHLSEKTNYLKESVNSVEALKKIANQALFPSHALIVRTNPMKNKGPLFKGIHSYDALEKAYHECAKHSIDTQVLVETDMRAQFNPSRMSVIGELATKLARRLATCCPQCKTPGWGIVETKKDLRCESCNGETDLISHEIFGCVRCDHKQTHPRTDGTKTAPPNYCLFCNP